MEESEGERERKRERERERGRGLVKTDCRENIKKNEKKKIN